VRRVRISFNRPPFVGKETEYIKEAVEKNGMICGDGPFTKKCSQWMKERFQTKNVLLTTSCTHALEMAAFLADIQPGDEVIMPSYTFVSTADAFVLRGATCVFVDIRPDTMNIDETKIEEAITEKTKAIVPVHYAGVSCAMDEIMAIAKKYNLKVVEDAAQGVNAFYKGKALGTIGDFGCYSFHETKNYSMGEGGAILFQDDRYLEPAEILREKGTNRSQYFRGQIDKYTWVGYGSSYLPSDMNAAYLWAQLEEADKINDKRLSIWNFYHEELKELEDKGVLERPYIPEYATHNAHMYYIKVKDLRVRTKLLAYLKERGILSVFHYVPLHSATAGKKFGRFHGEDVYTTKESERLCRLPMYYSLSLEEAAEVVKALKEFPEYETIEDR
jgi:dTDP-4-amino-4,6-dideoxygalactose transaminase